MMMRSSKNLVLTLANDLKPDQLKPFFETFRRSDVSAKIVVFYNRLIPEALELIKSYGAETIPFSYFSIRMRHPQCMLWPLWRWLFPHLPSFAWQRLLAHQVYNLFFLRGLLYLDYLEQHPDKGDWVFLVDVRDVIFQRNLFAKNPEPGLYCFLEGKGRTLASCPGNRRMILNCFGKKVLEELGNFEPSCAGTVLGDRTHILAYLKSMVEGAMSIHQMRMVPGDDQGLHNGLIRQNRIQDTILVDNDLGPIATLGCVLEDEIRVSPEGWVLQEDGCPYAVLHQYDRHKGLVGKHALLKSGCDLN
jgi:hypothetical protein